MKKTLIHGQSLIEVLVAIAIASLVAIGLVKATGMSIGNSSFSQDQSVATDLAQKKVAEIVAARNENPRNFFDPLPTPGEVISGDFCVKNTVTSINFSPTPADATAKLARITIYVFWDEIGDGDDCQDKKYKHKVKVESNITN